MLDFEFGVARLLLRGVERELRSQEMKESYVDGVQLPFAENELVLEGLELDLAVGNHFVHRGFPLGFLVGDRFLDDLGNRLVVFVQHLEHSLVLRFQLHAKLPQLRLVVTFSARTTTWLSVFFRESVSNAITFSLSALAANSTRLRSIIKSDSVYFGFSLVRRVMSDGGMGTEL